MTQSTRTTRPAWNLGDRLTQDAGTHFVPGLQALVAFPLEQARRDRAAGLRIGTFISGYPGSPLGTYDLALSRIPELLAEHDVSFVPAGNEELAATAHMGTQMLDAHPHSQWDGVTGIWYGKGPGVDRSGDALKHGNFAGTSTHGAVVVLSGEDHEAKSSTMPFQQEYAFVSAGIPVLSPATVEEFRTFGIHAIRLSRYSGCWVALKLTSALCDAGQSVSYAPGEPQVAIPQLKVDGKPFVKRTDFSFFPGKNIEMERHLYQEKHLAVQAYARENGLDATVVSGDADTVGIITAGKTATDLEQALTDLGLSHDELRRAGVRILKLGLVYPLDEQVVREFAGGLDDVIVIEEKRDFLEQQVRSVLQPVARPIRVVGKRDQHGAPLFPVEGGMDADVLAERLARLLAPVLPDLPRRPRVAEIAAVRRRNYEVQAGRTPNFCSGCPHSSSTVLAPGQVAWGAPGCNCFNTVIEQPERHIDVMTQYGGEGLPWIGLSRYTDREHMVQHVGDGSMYHSSYLNVRWAVAAGVNLTYKLLYNGVVANTGAQDAVGSRGLLELTRGLDAEGVARIVVMTKDPKQYRGAPLAPGVEIRPAHRMVETAQELATVPGVTVLVYDESCANERRRLQKRGELDRPTEYVVINEDVCENCGDCGAASNCMSLQKVPTEFGAKTRIHTSSCNQDYSCVQGDCPSFATVHTQPGKGYRKRIAAPLREEEIPAVPAPALRSPVNLYMPGVGGTGVLTLNGILSVAALLDGNDVLSFDQTGAAQKWGPVVSSLTVIPPGTAAHASKVGVGQADVYLALDEVGACSPANLDRCSPNRTTAVTNTDLFPTGEQVRDIHAVVDTGRLRATIAAYCREVVEVRARWIAEEVFGDYMLTNVIALGAAYQHGLLPLSAEAIEAAIDLNGVAVGANQQAFRYGRLWVADRARVEALIAPPQTDATTEFDHRAGRLDRRRRQAAVGLWQRTGALPEPTRRLLAVRLPELVDYQDGDYAAGYVGEVLRVAVRESEVAPGSHRLTDAVARGLYKLMAFKDEYEVARLSLKPDFAEHVAATFEGPVTLTHNLQPPMARRFGTRKLRVPAVVATPTFRALRTSRRLRGTAVDPFRRQQSRREERELIAWYRDLLTEALSALRPATFDTAVAIAELPDIIRGYEEVKRRNAVQAQVRARELVEGLRRPRLKLSPTA
ncbi:indolepyruvate ferredoxin oxidoreductase [Modestobacter sp. DSM 44400]|uniref:indolepyruvate ferredoxin oxidoreductase family protein n=1 Tax=Modestobacter sp. DSM 44400 TaxID=1550230 RepID=UPI0008960574|nr:indolepyruvate ferredoxin oxidoreductase family protein [Modestobacter sp. DSM 44400]SDY34419.1 indolepyruvate ferredoxin oxidoreductase [Modestobacter sp. DSM 44400]